MSANKFLKLIKLLLTSVFVFFIIQYIFNNYQNLINYDFKINIYFLLISLFILIFSILYNLNLWHLITKIFKCNLDYSLSITKRINSELGKYLPGRVLGYGYLYLIYKRRKKNIQGFIISSYYELLLTTLASITLFSIIQNFIDYDYLKDYRLYFNAVGIFSFIIIHPKIVEYLIKILNTIKSDKIITNHIKNEYKNILIIYFGYLTIWFLFGFAFYILVNSITNVSDTGFLYWTGLFSVSSFAGFLAFFMPSGLGAREGILIILLSSIVGETTAIIISIVSRLWIISGDLILFGTVNLMVLSRKYILRMNK